MDKILTIGIGALFIIGAYLYSARTAQGETVNDTNDEKNVDSERAKTRAKTRGIRNNNPGNIEDVGIPWDGLVGNDGRYAVFVTPIYGLRALMINLHTYMTKHNLRTVRGIITRWAPEHENPTNNYVDFVAREVNAAPDQPLQYSAFVIPLTRAIVQFENGYDPYTYAQYNEALLLSGRG